MADEPTWDGGDPRAPGGDRGSRRTDAAGAAEEHVTVEELLARTGTVRRRRAERREATGRQQRVDGYGAPVVRPEPGPPVPVSRAPEPAAPRPPAPQPPASPPPASQPPAPAVSRPPAPAVRPQAPAPGSRAGGPAALPPLPASAVAPHPVAAPAVPHPAATTPPKPAPLRPTPVRPVPVVPAAQSPGRAPAGPLSPPPVPAAPASPVPPSVFQAPASLFQPPASLFQTPVALSQTPVALAAAPPAPVTDTPRWVPGVDRPAVPPAPQRPGGPSPATPAPDRPAVPVAPAPTPPAPPRPLTPIEEQFGGTAHPSLPLPDRGVRLSMPVPPLPGLHPPAPRDGGRSGSTSAGLAPLQAPAGPGRRRLTRVLVALVAVLGVVASFYVGLYFYVDQSIGRVDALVTDGPEVLAPQLQNTSQTYLVVGTGLPGRSGPASVSTLIAHLPEAGDRAVLVTVPPTALTDTPMCRTADGSLRDPVTEPFATALLEGGPSCLVRSVQQLSGLRIDHYLGLDLAALPGMVDALGGVGVCLPTGVTAAGGQTLPAGESRLVGDDVPTLLGPSAGGTDVLGTTVAAHEQLVLTSTLRSALSGGTLADPVELTRFLARASDAFTVDADTTLGDVRALGSTLGELTGDAVQRGGVPVARVGHVPAGSDQAATLIDGAAARVVFDAVIDEGRLPAAADPAAVTADPAAAAAGTTTDATADVPVDAAPVDPVPPGTVVTVPPAGVTVDVLDATGAGRAAGTAEGLVAVGFRTGVVGAEPAAVDRTVVRYAPAALEPARTVVAAVPGSVLEASEQLAGGVQLVLGPGDAVVTPVGPGTPVPEAAAPDVDPAGAAACG